MPRAVNVEKIAEELGEQPFDPIWASYVFGGGWGNHLTKYRRKGMSSGRFVPGLPQNRAIGPLKRGAEKGDFTGYAGFFSGILCFYGDRLWDKFTFIDNDNQNRINSIVQNLEAPISVKDDLYEICHSKYDFEAFVRAASTNDELSFDPDSVIAVYRLQGDKAIFQLLCQMFYVNRGVEKLNACLIDDLMVDLPIEVSNYFSGCAFPVVVSPKVTDFKWKTIDNGWFLYAKYNDEWRVVDVAGVGRVVLANNSLSNRLNYLANGGLVLPYLVCWNFGDIIEAYHYFGGDLLVRDLKNTLFDHYWFYFGADSKVCVRSKDGFINSESSNQVKFFDGMRSDLSKSSINYLIIDLLGRHVGECRKEDIVFSDSEVKDILEIGQLLNNT